MKQILFINSCVRPTSRTLQLAQHLLSQLDGDITEISLEKEGITSLDWPTLQLRDELLAKKDFSHPLLRYAHQFAQADTIVVAAPYWDLAFPATLRTYLEAVTVCGITFGYTPEGVPQGFCNAKHLYYVTTAGGPIGENNWGYDYVRSLCRTFYGIPETHCFQAENLDVWGSDVSAILEKSKATIDQTFQK